MTVKRIIDQKDKIFFITFSCFRWIPLFEIVSGYDIVYNWFENLKKNNIMILGYVIMPNHVHVLIYQPKMLKNLNTIVGNGKRFMAYEIVTRLKKQNMVNVLKMLKRGVSPGELRKGKLHKVFNTSFDVKICESRKFTEQKLDYIHHNPVKGKWNLVDDFTKYKHSSSIFYEKGIQPVIPITHYMEFL